MVSFEMQLFQYVTRPFRVMAIPRFIDFLIFGVSWFFGKPVFFSLVTYR